MSAAPTNSAAAVPASAGGVPAWRACGPFVVIGGRGMLGRAVLAEMAKARAEAAAPGHAELDLTRAETFAAGIPAGTRAVINCAAWTDVDGAESDEAGAYAVNGTGVAALAARCRELGATLVHFSTDYVFPGESAEPYRIDGPRGPLGAYGRTKAAGEEAVEREIGRGLRALIVRTSWLYAPWGKNFVRTIARAAGERPALRVVNDQRGRPTSSEHLARATLALLGAGEHGFRHVTDGGECTWHEFATEIVRLAGRAATCRVDPCTTAEFARPAPRPAYSVLDLSVTEAAIGAMPHWTKNLADVMRRLEPA